MYPTLMRASALPGSRMSTFWNCISASSYFSWSICAQPSSDSACGSLGASCSALVSESSAPAKSPSEMRLHPFSMKVDAPMWSATTGRSALKAGAIVSLSPFHFSTSDFASSLSDVSSARSCSSPLPSAINSPRRASRCSGASSASNCTASACTRSRYALAQSPIRHGLRLGLVECDALGGGQQLLDVEEDHQLLRHADDSLEVLGGEPAEQLGRRRDRGGIERRDRGDGIHDGPDPFATAVQDEDARLVAHLDVRHLEPPAQVDDRNDAPLVVDDSLDVRRHVRHGCRRRVAQDALDREDVGGEEVIAEPEGDELVRFDFHASSGTGMAWQASTSASASTSATMLPSLRATPSTTGSLPSTPGASRRSERSRLMTSSTSSIASANRPRSERKISPALRRSTGTPSASSGVNTGVSTPRTVITPSMAGGISGT